MKLFFELGDRYAKKSNWQDFALVKFCLCAMGILIGLCVPAKHKKKSAVAAGSVFFATYIPLMTKVFATLGEMLKENEEMLEDEEAQAIEEVIAE